MDLVKVHEGHMRVLENELAAHKAALHKADQREAALLREQQSLALEARRMDEKMKAAQDLLDMKKKEAADIQDLVQRLLYLSSVIDSSPSLSNVNQI